MSVKLGHRHLTLSFYRLATGGGERSLRVCVEAHKVSLRTGAREPTNEFHFVFRAPRVEEGEVAESMYFLASGRSCWQARTGDGLPSRRSAADGRRCEPLPLAA